MLLSFQAGCTSLSHRVGQSLWFLHSELTFPVSLRKLMALQEPVDGDLTSTDGRVLEHSLAYDTPWGLSALSLNGSEFICFYCPKNHLGVHEPGAPLQLVLFHLYLVVRWLSLPMVRATGSGAIDTGS